MGTGSVSGKEICGFGTAEEGCPLFASGNNLSGNEKEMLVHLGAFHNNATH